MGVRDGWSMLRETFTEWQEDKAPQLGASLAFYSILSLAPLVVIVLAIAGAFFGDEAARGELVSQIRGLVGTEGGQAIEEMIAHARKPTTGILATILGTATLLFGASGVFGQLQDALNTIWDVKPKPGRGVWGFIRDRFFSFTMVLGTGFLLLVSLALSAGLAAVGRYVGGLIPGAEAIWTVVNALVSFAVIAGLFALIFKYVPDVKIQWKDVLVGAVITAAFFTIGKLGLGLYLGTQGIGSAYGAAGSLVVLVVWVYYSAQILLFGAEFTQVYARFAGSPVVPSANAIPADEPKQQADRRVASAVAQ